MKRFNLKLTLSLVSLFISIVFCALGNLSNYCLFFGLIMMSVATVLFMIHKLDDLRLEQYDYSEKYYNEDLEEEKYTIIIKSIQKERKKLVISFTTFAVVMLVLAIVIL